MVWSGGLGELRSGEFWSGKARRSRFVSVWSNLVGHGGAVGVR